MSAIGQFKPIKIMLLAGGDLVQSFAAPDVWATADVSSWLHDRMMCKGDSFPVKVND